jgi:hypothetical protein
VSRMVELRSVRCGVAGSTDGVWWLLGGLCGLFISC